MKTVLLLWLGSMFLTPASNSVGFQQLSVPDPQGKTLSAAVWFPSVGKPVSVSVGPFQQKDSQCAVPCSSIAEVSRRP